MRLAILNWNLSISRKDQSPPDVREIERSVRQAIIDDLAKLVKERVDNRKGRRTQGDEIIIAIMYRIAGRNPVAEILKQQGLS